MCCVVAEEGIMIVWHSTNRQTYGTTDLVLCIVFCCNNRLLCHLRRYVAASTVEKQVQHERKSTMSRHIWSVKTFKKRVGQSVTVDGTKCTVSEKGGKYIIRAKDGTLHLELEELLLKPWLRHHVVVASGYPLKRESSKPAKNSSGYTRDLKEVPFNTLVTVKFEHLSTQAKGMFVRDIEMCGQPGVFFVSNDDRLDGCPCKNRHGFEHSYLISSNDRSAYGFKDIKEVVEKPVQEQDKAERELYKITYGHRSCIGFLKKAGDGNYIITDSEAFAGASTSDEFREGFKYSWWVADCNVEDVKLEPVSGKATEQEPDEGPVKGDPDVLDMTIRELLELVITKLKA